MSDNGHEILLFLESLSINFSCRKGNCEEVVVAEEKHTFRCYCNKIEFMSSCCYDIFSAQYPKPDFNMFV